MNKRKLNIMVFCLLCTLMHSTMAQRPQIRFEHLDISNGLSSNTVNTAIQDSRGFLWVGTQNGLNRYDGYEFKKFSNDTSNNSLSNSTVDCIYEDKKGNLWIGTFEGLNIYERQTGRILNTTSDSTLMNQLALNNAINDIIEDNHGKFWLATGWKGILVLEDHKIIKSINTDSPENSRIPSNIVTKLAKDEDGSIWIGTTNGFCHMSQKNHKSICFSLNGPPGANNVNDLCIIGNSVYIGTKLGLAKFDKNTHQIDYLINDPYSYMAQISAINVKRIIKGNNNNLWIATENQGVLYYDISHAKYYAYTTSSHCNISSDHITHIAFDKNGGMWVTTKASGINFSNYKTNMFTNWVSSGINTTGMGSGPVTAFIEDKKGNLWTGVEGKGLYKLDKNRQLYDAFEANENLSSLESNIKSIALDDENNFWIATFGGGIHIANPDTGQGIISLNKRNDNLKSDQLSHIEIDHYGNIWVGTSSDGLILKPINYLDTTFFFKHNSNDVTSLSNDMITFVYSDSGNRLWVGTYGGLNLFNYDDSTFFCYTHSDINEGTISSAAVTCIHEDRTGIIWVGTGNGLNKFDPVKDRFTTFTTEDGLSSDVIYSIEEDERGHLWISTDEGICRFHTASHRVLKFDRQDGLVIKDFQMNSSYKNKEGNLFFGGINGYTMVAPSGATRNTIKPVVHLTNLSIHHKQVSTLSENTPLIKAIEETEELLLNYKQSVITIEFTALNFVTPEKNEYAYWLKGFDDDWNYIDHKRSVTFTNLDPGNYELHIKATNNDGVWSQNHRVLRIIIKPPIWRTWWFQGIGVAVIVGILFLIYNLRVRSIKKKNKILEERVVERTEEVRAQNEQILKQKDQILIQKQQMEDNMEVAKIVQMSVLPPEDVLKKKFPDSFILHQPKDIVSGDFYWIMQRGKRYYIATADCTGHGVAGGFLTMIGHNHLTEIVNNNNRLAAGAILDKLHAKIVETLRQRKDGSKSQDGMDISICIFEEGSNVMQYAGAINSIILIPVNEHRIINLEVDLNMIGSTFIKDNKSFNTYKVELNAGDSLYMYSDGFADQFGGNKGIEKLKKRRFQQFILDQNNLPMTEQCSNLQKFFTDWRGEVEQFDDILIVGYKV